MENIIAKEFAQAAEVLANFSNEENFRRINTAIEMLTQALKNGNKIISCGNGGSHADAMHFAEELSGKYRNPRPALGAIAISDPTHISCVGNDYGYPFIFSRFVEALGNNGDILFAISTSGNSENVLNAVKAAHQKEMLVLALTGNNGGELAKLANHHINVPHIGYADRIQEVHIKIIHTLILGIEKSLGY